MRGYNRRRLHTLYSNNRQAGEQDTVGCQSSDSLNKAVSVLRDRR